MKTGIILFALLGFAMAAVAQQKAPVFDPLNPPDTARSVPAAKPQPKSELKPQAVAAPAPPMVVTPAPEPAAPVVPKGPQIVPYDELETQVGKSIVVRTNLHTTRKGTLKRFNRAVLVIQDMSRGFAMDIEIPRSTVAEVKVMN